MKKVLSVVLVMVLMLSIMPMGLFSITASAATGYTPSFSGGTGTKYDPYIIKYAFDLNRVKDAPSSYFRLEKDIVFTENDFAEGGRYYNKGECWLPIGGAYDEYGWSLDSFTGTFDGNGHTISNLVVKSDDYSGAGLFGRVEGGTIKNLGLVNCNIETTGNHAGGIVGTASNAIISNCYVTGKVAINSSYSGTYYYLGGIVSYAWNTTIANCYTTANVSVVYLKNTDGYLYQGGILGEATGTTTITNCYSVGDAGDSLLGKGTGLKNSYYLLYGNNTNNNVGRTLVEMEKQATYEGFDFNAVWQMDANSEYPLPTLKNVPHKNTKSEGDTKTFAGGEGNYVNPYKIATKAQLNNVHDYYNSHFVLIDDIEFTNDDFAYNGTYYNSGSYWEPIGIYKTYYGGTQNSFTGVFDGNGHTISGLKINGETYYVGLFASVKNATIKNLGMINGVITANSRTYYAGGIAGAAYGDSRFINCFNTSNITFSTASTSPSAGGIVGSAASDVQIINCFNSGNIKAISTSSIEDVSYSAHVGGIEGYGLHSPIISNCYNTGKIYGSSPYVVWIDGISYAGGTLCYNIGSIDAYGKTVFGCISSSGSFTDCYYLYNANKKKVYYTKSEMQQQEPYVGFDFNNVWCIDKLRDYPYPQLRDNMRNPKITKVEISRFPAEVTSYPNKVITIEGVVPELSGGEITVTYKDGSSYTTAMTGGMLSDINLNKIGEQESHVNYCGQVSSNKILVEVIAKDLTGIKVTTKPTKLEYVKDQPLDLAGGKVSLYYNNNSVEEIDLSQVELSYDTTATGTVVVSAKYQGYIDTFDITVNPKVVKSISLMQKPTVVEYLEGVDLDLTGGILKVIYESSDNFFENINLTEDMISGYDKNVLGYQVVYVNYQGCQTNYRVYTLAKSLTEIKVTTKPDKLIYLEGDTLDTAGLVVTAYYDNHTTEVITDLVTISGYSSTPGTKTIKVTFGEKNDSFAVVVNEKELVSIEVTTNPNKLKYFEEEDFDPTGIVVTAYYNNGTSNFITNYTFNIKDTVCGVRKIEVSYAGKSTYIEITILYTVVFQNWNGDVLSTKIYNYGDEVEVPTAPTKAADNTYTYTFAGWDKEIVECEGNTVYVANYTSNYIDYTVTFKNWNGDILSTRNYHYGDSIFVPKTPTKEGNETYSYVFAGWDKNVVNCAGDATYTAIYAEVYVEYSIIFINWNGEIISNETYHYGETVQEPSIPSRESTNVFKYTFNGWDNEVVNCESNATYTATYTPTYIDYTVVFKNWDGTILSSKTYHWGDKVTAPSAPTKAADNTYTYTFAGWDSEVVNCLGDSTYTATYTSNYIDYTVVFKDWNGDVLSTKTYHYGDAVIAPVNPTRIADNIYTYTFNGWNKTVVDCTGDTIYTATYTQKYIDYNVVFKNYNGIILSTETYHYGDTVTAPSIPTKPADNTYTYSFAGWDSNITACNGNKVYTATYTSTYIDYTIIFKNYNGTVLSTKTYHYGDTIVAPSTPTKPADNTYTYIFAGWDSEVVNCVGDAIYTATYTADYIDYTVVFKNWNGEVLSTKAYHYGDAVIAPNAPTKLEDDEYTYTFVGWDSSVVACNGNKTYTAIFNSIRKYVVGDIDGVDGVTDADAECLLMYTFFPDDYPVNQDCDFDGNGKVNDADAEYLLMHTFFPDDYPLH